MLAPGPPPAPLPPRGTYAGGGLGDLRRQMAGHMDGAAGRRRARGWELFAVSLNWDSETENGGDDVDGDPDGRVKSWAAGGGEGTETSLPAAGGGWSYLGRLWQRSQPALAAAPHCFSSLALPPALHCSQCCLVELPRRLLLPTSIQAGEGRLWRRKEEASSTTSTSASPAASARSTTTAGSRRTRHRRTGSRRN